MHVRQTCVSHVCVVCFFSSMKAISNDLAKVAHKWYQIGLQLGVNCRDLDKIKGEENGAQACLSKMLSHSLSTNAGADQVDMLVSNTINEQQLARKLRNNRGTVWCQRTPCSRHGNSLYVTMHAHMDVSTPIINATNTYVA